MYLDRKYRLKGCSKGISGHKTPKLEQKPSLLGKIMKCWHARIQEAWRNYSHRIHDYLLHNRGR